MASRSGSSPAPLHEEERQQSTLELVRGIASDTSTLVRKELELARIEIVEAVVARVKGIGALGGAGICGLIAILFGGAAGAAALSNVMPVWAALLIVMGAFLGIAGMAAVMGIVRMKSPPLAPKETERTIEEDVRWAKEALKR
jgi:Putative Actinobacterial Holin-X, holin superfamily III